MTNKNEEGARHMRIGLFTDTYFPQISGVATSIQTLKNQLEAAGHEVVLFTTTDPLAKGVEEPDNIVRFRSVPFIAMKERRMVMAGLRTNLKIVTKYKLDIIHTHTEFGMGVLGKFIAHELRIPMVHTFHTKYEDYLHYIMKGKLIKPRAVKYFFKTFLFDVDGLICPSEMTASQARNYGVKMPIKIVPTGVDIEKFKRPEITKEDSLKLRAELGIPLDETFLLSVSRLSYEKNIHAVINSLPKVLEQKKLHFVIVGHGPYLGELQALVEKLELNDVVHFIGAVEHQEVAKYYKAADFFISASTSETQGLTFSESIAAGTPILAWRNPHLETLVTAPAFGKLFDNEEQIADSIIEVIDNTTVGAGIPQDLYEAKCYEMSSEHMRDEIVSFYEETLANHKRLELKKLMEPIVNATNASIEKTTTVIKNTHEKTTTAIKKTQDKTNELTKKAQNNVKEVFSVGERPQALTKQ